MNAYGCWDLPIPIPTPTLFLDWLGTWTNYSLSGKKIKLFSNKYLRKLPSQKTLQKSITDISSYSGVQSQQLLSHSLFPYLHFRHSVISRWPKITRFLKRFKKNKNKIKKKKTNKELGETWRNKNFLCM